MSKSQETRPEHSADEPPSALDAAVFEDLQRTVSSQLDTIERLRREIGAAQPPPDVLRERLDACEASLRIYDQGSDSEYWLRYSTATKEGGQ